MTAYAPALESVGMQGREYQIFCNALRSRRFAGYVGGDELLAEDFRSELWAWWLAHAEQIRFWRSEPDGERRLFASLKNACEDFRRKDERLKRAEISLDAPARRPHNGKDDAINGEPTMEEGLLYRLEPVEQDKYHSAMWDEWREPNHGDDQVTYSKNQLRDLLPIAIYGTSPRGWGDFASSTGGGDPATGGNFSVMLMDVRLAMLKLARTNHGSAQVLFWAGWLDYDYDAIGSKYGVSSHAAELRVGRALGRLRNTINNLGWC